MSSRNKPHISVIIATYNRPDMLQLVLESYQRQSSRDFEIIIADDGSTPETNELINSYQRKVWFPIKYAWQADKGFRKTMILNKSAALAEGNYLFFTDQDCVAQIHLIQRLMQICHPAKVFQVERTFLNEEFTQQCFLSGLPDEEEVNNNAQIKPHYRLFRRIFTSIGIVAGFGYLVPRPYFLEINGFNEAYLSRGCGEDTEIGYRLKIAGCKVRFAGPRFQIYHLWHPIDHPRHWPANNNQFLYEALSRRLYIRCEKGLDRHLLEKQVQVEAQCAHGLHELQSGF